MVAADQLHGRFRIFAIEPLTGDTLKGIGHFAKCGNHHNSREGAGLKDPEHLADSFRGLQYPTSEFMYDHDISFGKRNRSAKLLTLRKDGNFNVNFILKIHERVLHHHAE
jgi:hypothetical protein